MRHVLGGIILAAATAAIPTGADALVLGQIDTFQDGTTDGWSAGGVGNPSKVPPNPPFVMSTGGPAGAGDKFLVITSVGCNPAVCGSPDSPPGTGVPGSNLTAFNAFGQWSGDYTSIAGVSMELENLGSTSLTIRLELEDPPAGGDSILSTTGAVLAPGSGWQQVFFPTAELSDWSDMVDVSAYGFPPADAAFDLSNASVLRIIDAPTDTSDFTPIVAQLGVDDITAVPEPPSILLLGAALLGLAITVRRPRISRIPLAAGVLS